MHVSTLTHKNLFAKSIVGWQSRLDFLARPWCDPLLVYWFLGAAHFLRSDSCVWPTSQDQIPGCAPLLEIWFLGVTHFSGSDSWLPPTSRDLRAWYRPLLGIWLLGRPSSRDLISYHWICQIFLQSPAPFQRHLSASNSAPLQPSLVKKNKKSNLRILWPPVVSAWN